MSEIILYDIPSVNAGRAWGPNTWKTRYTLNLKGLPYKTEWVEYPDIEAVSKKLGAPPTGKRPDGSPLYTVPFIFDPKTNRVVVESFAIAEYLDATYPDTPPVVPPSTRPLQQAFIDTTYNTVLGPMRPFTIPASFKIMNPRSQEYLRLHKEKAFGKPMEEVTPTGEKKVMEWQKIKAEWNRCYVWLQKGKDAGPWFGGKDPLFVDLAVASRLLWFREAFGEESLEWTDIKTWNGGYWAKFIDDLKKYETVA